MEWNEAEREQLRQLWDEGHSCTEIGRRMNISKAAVAGKAHRMLLPMRESPIKPSASELVSGVDELTPEQRESAAALARYGHSVDEIARRIGAKRNVVRRAGPSLGIARFGSSCTRVVVRSDGVAPLRAKGAAALQRARETSGMLRAEAFRRHAQQGGGVVPGSAAHQTPAAPRAMAGIPDRPGDYAEAPAGCRGGSVSSLDLPPAVATRPAVFSGDDRGCRWPLWADAGRPDHTYCGARRARGSYCAVHGERAVPRHTSPGVTVAVLGGWEAA